MNGWIDPAKYGLHSRQWLGHSFRYHLARGFIRSGDRALDAACGVGYGAFILSQRAEWVAAMDVDKRALEIARKKYNNSNIEYFHADFDRDDILAQFDVAVSFETIEHLHNPARFVNLLHKAAERLIILSAPVVPTVHLNKHHKHDFTEKSLRQLVLQPPWTLWEEVRQGPYLIIIAYNRDM